MSNQTAGDANGHDKVIPPPPIVQKVPPPKTSSNLVSRRDACKFSKRSRTWLSDRVADGSIKDHGERKGDHGRASRLVSLKEVLKVSANWPTKKRAKAKVSRPDSDLISQGEAGRLAGRSSSWVVARIKNGDVLFYGTRTGTQGGYPQKLISRKEILAVSEGWPRRETARSKKSAPPKKARAISQFAREELRHFAQHIMVDILGASSLTITEKSDGTFDISMTPRAPTVANFKV